MTLTGSCVVTQHHAQIKYFCDETHEFCKRAPPLPPAMRISKEFLGSGLSKGPTVGSSGGTQDGSHR